MLQQTGDNGLSYVGLFLNPVGQRRNEFQDACGAAFAQLFLADGVEQAGDLLAQQPVDLLVIDLERFARGIDLELLGALVKQRAGAPVLLVCPFGSAGWLPDLMACGPLDYVIGPLDGAGMREAVTQRLARPAAPAGQAQAQDQLRELLALRSRAQRAVAEADDFNKLAEQLCAVLCGWPGVVHASLFHLKAMGDLQLEAQHASGAVNLAGILPRTDRLLQSPLRHAFPGLLAAASGELAYLDAPDKAGEPELAVALREKGVRMVLGVPIPSAGPGAVRGTLCLMFEHSRPLSRDELDAFGAIAEQAGIGLRMAEMQLEGEQLAAQLMRLATIDALTGVANRRHGEDLVEAEIKRSRRYKLPLALIAFDIDHFKMVNDRYGHPCGDVALRIIAEAAQGALRSSDVLARSAGQEFQILAPHTSAIDALKMAEKIRCAIAQTPIPGCDRLTVSLGVGQLGEQESGDMLAQRVNAALARAKRAGRNCVELAM